LEVPCGKWVRWGGMCDKGIEMLMESGKSINQLRTYFLSKRKSRNNAGSEKGENSNCERREWNMT